MTPQRFHRLRSVLERRQPDLTVLLDNVHKPHNLSAVLRTADAVGVFELHAVTPKDSRPVRVRPHKAVAQGSGKWTRVVRHTKLREAAASLRAPWAGEGTGEGADEGGDEGPDEGLQILAAHLAPGSVDYREVDYTRPTALLLGQEKDGVSPEAAALADRWVEIPMEGMVASLNVSVAAALLLFEARRQREAAGLYEAPRPLGEERFERTLFEWCYPYFADLCRRRGIPYPPLGEDGEILGELPRG